MANGVQARPGLDRVLSVVIGLAGRGGDGFATRIVHMEACYCQHAVWQALLLTDVFAQAHGSEPVVLG